MFGSNEANKKVTQEDLDMIRIKIEDMTSTEDKIFLMEKLYCHINSINNEIKGYRASVKQINKERYEELLQLKEDAQDIRRCILGYKLPSDHYGLFVRYPKGYEG